MMFVQNGPLRRTRWRFGLTMVAVGVLQSWGASSALAAWGPTYQLVESGKKTYGPASRDLRGIGCIDFWFVGHDRTDGPMLCDPGHPGAYALSAFTLPTVAVDGTNMDRHECGFMHLNDDRLIDMACALGADRGTGSGPNEVFRNDSTTSDVRFTRITTPTGVEDLTGRSRTMEPFRWADGQIGLWITEFGDYRVDGKPNWNRTYRYDGSGSFHFTEVVSSQVNITTRSNCSRAADLNGDGLDDLLLCRNLDAGGKSQASSVLLYQQSDMTWAKATLPMSRQRWYDAAVADLNGDGRMDLAVSAMSGSSHWLDIYFQGTNGKFPTQPSWSVTLPVQGNSIAVNDLDGDGRLDLYVTQSDKPRCMQDGENNGVMVDTWPDIVLHSNGAPSGWTRVEMTQEPRTNGCSWLASAAEPGFIHLGRGYEGYAGDNYVLHFQPLVGLSRRPAR